MTDYDRIAAGTERLDVMVGSPAKEFAAVSTTWMVERWDAEQTEWARQRLELHPLRALTAADFRRANVKSYHTTVHENANLVVQAGWVALLGGVAGTTMSPKFGAANARIGVGTSATAAAFSNTTLGGDTGAASTTSFFKLCSGAPTISTGSAPCTLVFAAAFGTAQANFAWAEFGTDAGTADSVSNATTGGTFFNHGISAQGTKASGQTWTATETLSFGFPSGSGTVS
jgi:hypothetical protein